MIDCRNEGLKTVRGGGARCQFSEESQGGRSLNGRGSGECVGERGARSRLT